MVIHFNFVFYWHKFTILSAYFRKTFDLETDKAQRGRAATPNSYTIEDNSVLFLASTHPLTSICKVFAVIQITREKKQVKTTYPKLFFLSIN